MIVYTGANGSIGSDMPKDSIALTTRLEASVEEMGAELTAKTNGGTIPFSFIHLAGLVQVSECEQNPKKAYALNVDGTLRWYEAFSKIHLKNSLKNDFGRFVFASTGHVYAASLEKRTIHSPTDARSVYAKTKLQAELSLKEQQLVQKTPVTVARIFSVWPRVLKPSYLLTSLHEKAQKKDFSPIPGLSNTRDFLTSQEICASLCKLAQEKNSQGYLLANVCSGKGTTIAEVAEKIFAQYGLDKIPPEAPGRVTDVKYLVGEPSNG